MSKSLQLPYANVTKLSKTVGVVHKKSVYKICRSILFYFRHIGLFF